MKKILLTIIASLCVFSLIAQTQDAQLERMMTKKALSREEVGLNIAYLAPTLYKENKVDTIKQLISYYERNFILSISMAPLKFLTEIKERSFKEELNTRQCATSGYDDTTCYNAFIISYLHGFGDLCRNLIKPTQFQPDVRETYGTYASFIGHLADELKTIPDLSPAEKFLLRYYSHPTDTALKTVTDPEYAGTRIQRQWFKEHAEPQKKPGNSVSGISLGVAAGAWVPFGNLSLLGPHPYIGFILGGRGQKFAIDANLTMRFLNSKSNYEVMVDNTIYNSRHYFGGYVGIDGLYELTKKGKNAMDIVGGIAWDGMDAFSELQ